jgi:S1-C subfamily serine protease
LAIYTTVKNLTDEIIVSTAINGGGSGGALFNSRGELIGILIAADDGLGETYITPINTIRKAL